MPWMLLLKPTVLLGIALTASVAVNYGLFQMWKTELIRVGQVKAELTTAMAAGEACNKAVAQLKADTERRAREVQAALAVARARAIVVERKAKETLQARPSQPGDLCASAVILSRDKMKERRGG